MWEVTRTRFVLVVDGKEHSVEAAPSRGVVAVTVGGREWTGEVSREGDSLKVLMGGTTHVILIRDGKAIVDGIAHEVWTIPGPSPTGGGVSASAGGAASAEGAAVLPPMPGRVIQVLVEEGAEVDAGDPLLILEAMKMQNEVPSPSRGTVKEIRVREGDSVLATDVLLTLA